MFDRLAENAEVRKKKRFAQGSIFGVVDLDDQKLPGKDQQERKHRAANNQQDHGPNHQQQPGMQNRREQGTGKARAAWPCKSLQFE